MAQYISKSFLVAEIERRLELNDTCQKISGGNEFYRGAIDEAKEILSLLDTLEVKEVDLEKEINEWQGCEAFPEGVGITPLPKAMEIVERTAKHFFELALSLK